MALLTDIESNMKSLIEGMTIAGGYNFDWGAANIEDEAQVVKFPSPLVFLTDLRNQDDVDTGAHAQSYRQLSVFQIVVRGQISSESNTPNFAINPFHNDALDDLLKLFGNNYSINSTCDVIFFRSMSRDIQRTGDRFRPTLLITNWDVYFQQDRTDPSIMG